ncbi:MAG TPA: hypothetical protein VG104_01260 [Candidatus Dormibacteraeota bacterium]|jgi:hypothetical protein|nr:hypothetical protein [Candidatus Dormibacteraeota bacterium]
MTAAYGRGSDLTVRLIAQGREAMSAGRWMEAEYALRTALEQEPGNWMVMRDLASVLRELGQKREARQVDAKAAALKPAGQKPAKRSWLRRLGLAEFLLMLLNPLSLGTLLIASMLLPLLPWIAVAYYRLWPNRSRTLQMGIIGWIFLRVRLGSMGPFILGLVAGFLWLAILGPYATADPDMGLRLFTGFIALFTALCALHLLVNVALRLRRIASRPTA